MLQQIRSKIYSEIQRLKGYNNDDTNAENQTEKHQSNVEEEKHNEETIEKNPYLIMILIIFRWKKKLI